jgi:tetratricopeptide (TPR) repeat protein
MTEAKGTDRGRPAPGDRRGEDLLARAIAAAMSHVANGAYDEAVRAVEAGGRAVATHPFALNLLGNIYRQQGRQREALRAFEAAAKAAPRFPEAHCNRGVVLQELGRHEEALAAYGRALALRAVYPMAHYNRANLLKALGRSEGAIAAYDMAIKQEPNFPEAHLSRGHEFLKINRPLDALNDFDRVIAQRSSYREALLGKAQTLVALRRAREALTIAEILLGKNSADVDALSLKATALGSLKRFSDELVVILELLEQNPKNVAAGARKSVILRRLKRLDESLAAADEAVKLSETSHEGHHARALVLGELGRLDEELQELQKAEDLGARPTDVAINRAIALGSLGRLVEAEALFEQVRTQVADDPAMRTSHALNLLHSGDLERGWEEYEQRLQRHDFEERQLAELAPQWRGENIRNKKLLVYQEQGLGDAIQFVRYMKLLARFEAEISLIVGGVLLQLFQANLPGVDVTDTLGFRSGFYRQVSLMSLPFVFRTRLDTVPNDVPYLRADPDRVKKWRARLVGDDVKIGLCWQGNKKLARDHFRSIPLAAFAPLSSVRGLRLFSLQVGDGLDQLEHLPAGMKVETLDLDTVAASNGFAEVAAIMPNIDLVISVDTAIAHLAGALAVPVWTAIRAESEWRWLQDRVDSPWYPTMRLFRQAKTGDWSDVIARMAKELGDSSGPNPIHGARD